MQALAFWKAVAMDRTNFLEGLIALLGEHKVRYCVIGGQGVNAYAEPLVSLDLDLVVAVDQLKHVEKLLGERFHLEQFPHSLNVSAEGSQLRVQIQTDPRYFQFPERSSLREVLGLRLPVAAVEDVLDGKIWAVQDPERRPSKRRKDLLDVERLIEAHPRLRARVPAEILTQLA
jgi:nucleotidyltransferase AbiEii toxin of type IV toxin-antitoxin system